MQNSTQEKTDKGMLRFCSRLIRQRRESPRFIGRRSLDKTHGEVVDLIRCDGLNLRLVERIDLQDSQGEEAASKRAEELSDEWNAKEIIKLIQSAPTPHKSHA